MKLILLIAGTLFLFSCGDRSETPLPAIRVADARFLDSAPLYVGIEKGIFRRHGIKLEVLPFVDGKQSLDAVIAGVADVALTGDFPAAVAATRLKAPPFAIIATLDGSHESTAVVARTDRGIREEADLRGKKIGVSRGTVAEYFLAMFLGFNHIPETEVAVVDVPMGELERVYETGRVDAIAAADPYFSRAASSADSTVFHGTGVYRLFWLVTASRTALAENREGVRRFLRALDEAADHARKNPGETAAISSRYLSTDRRILARQIPLHEYRLRLQHPVLLRVEDQARWAIRNGYVQRREVPDVSTFFDPEPMLEVKPEMVTLIHFSPFDRGSP